MPMTARVTAQAADLGARPQPTWHPLVRVALDRPAVTADGVAVTTEPVEMVDDGTGTLVAELIVTDEFTTPVRYVPTVEWLSPSGGTSLRDTLPLFIVPPGGGSIGELALVATNWGLAWEGADPPASSMLWLYIDPTYDPESDAPLPTYVTEGGDVITHGELVEWDAGPRRGVRRRLAQLRGPQGMPGPKGEPGMDGDPNAVADFTASVARIVSDDTTVAHGAVAGVVGDLAPGLVSEQIATPGTGANTYLTQTVVQAGDARYPKRSAAETITGNWTYDRGRTTDEGAVRLGLQRQFRAAQGDLYDADTRLEFRVGRQHTTTQSPPGYSSAEIVLSDRNATNDPQFHGETTWMRIISNRFLFNRRLEVYMGGGLDLSRATLRAGQTTGQQLMRLMFHDVNDPELRICGPDNVGDKNLMDVRGMGVRVTSPAGVPTAQQWVTTDAQGTPQDVRLQQYPAGHQTLESRHNGVSGGVVRFEHSDRSLRFSAPGGVEVTSADLRFSPGFGPVLTSPGGALFRLQVSNTGALSAVAL